MNIVVEYESQKKAVKNNYYSSILNDIKDLI